MPAILINGDTLKLLDVAWKDGRLAPHAADYMGIRTSEGKLLPRIDAAITDPPYGISLDGDREWDTFTKTSAVKSPIDDAREFQTFIQGVAYRINHDLLLPGGHIAAFCDVNTNGRCQVGINEAGYELQTQIAWCYSTGQVKHKAKLGPAFEPITIARKPTTETLAALFKKTGRGLFHTEAMAIEEGRHPRNFFLDEALLATADYGDDPDPIDIAILSAPKFFYVSKPSVKERDYGCDRLPLRPKEGGLSGDGLAGRGKPSMARNIHPTVKPIDIMRRLVRLLTKPGAWVFDPFMGSGTTGVACMLEGRNFVGIEREPEFFEICQHRIGQAEKDFADGKAA